MSKMFRYMTTLMMMPLLIVTSAIAMLLNLALIGGLLGLLIVAMYGVDGLDATAYVLSTWVP